MTTATTTAHLAVVEPTEDRPGYVHRVCHHCGWHSDDWNPAHAPGITMKAGRCPQDRTVVELTPVQTRAGGEGGYDLFTGCGENAPTVYDIHLVPMTPNGSAAPMLCGMPRFGKDAPGWSLRGGVYGPGVVQRPCADCCATAVAEYLGLPVGDGVGAAEVRAAVEGATR